jgi:hypothetical protein
LHELVPGLVSAPLIDGVVDAIWATLFPSRVLLFNTRPEQRKKRLCLSTPELRSLGLSGPREVELEIPGYEILEIPLREVGK